MLKQGECGNNLKISNRKVFNLYRVLKSYFKTGAAMLLVTCGGSAPCRPENCYLISKIWLELIGKFLF